MRKAICPGPWLSSDDPARLRSTVVRRYEEHRWCDAVDEVAAEEPLQIQLSGQDVAVIMRTPGQDRALAAGFLFSEGIIAGTDDLSELVLGLDRDGFPQPNVLDVRLSANSCGNEPLVPRMFPVSSSCGLCGATSVESVMRRVQPLPVREVIGPALLLDLEAKLRNVQAAFRRTGGVHGAGLFDWRGELVLVHEDVGRHNAVDKLIGEMLLDGRLPLSAYGLLVSGRASFELLQKAALAGIPLFVAVGAPSSLAIELAVAAHVTLVGLLRSHRFVVYSCPERLQRHSDEPCTLPGPTQPG
ncbi:MAG TPA: formate dehydrogenase accessory sulfurtransferase FdhD [Chloroflexota bacterium]|nr:formate dehydrogenase accessory sulfurtransferase FdhD [Chloroflexota bacterium]